VRNRRDGSVEAMLSGTLRAVDQLVDWARRGPPGAVVSAVDIFAGEGHFDAFEVA
jgi:acylphosphatase